MVCNLRASWLMAGLDIKDYKAKDRLLDKIISCLPMDEDETMPLMVGDCVKLCRNVGFWIEQLFVK